MSFGLIVPLFVAIFVTPVCFIVVKAKPSIRVGAVLTLAVLFIPLMQFAFEQGIRHGKVALWRNLSEPTQKLLLHFEALGENGLYAEIDAAVDQINQASDDCNIDFHPNGVEDRRYVLLVDDIIKRSEMEESKDSPKP